MIGETDHIRNIRKIKQFGTTVCSDFTCAHSINSPTRENDKNQMNKENKEYIQFSHRALPFKIQSTVF